MSRSTAPQGMRESFVKQGPHHQEQAASPRSMAGARCNHRFDMEEAASPSNQDSSAHGNPLIDWRPMLHQLVAGIREEHRFQQATFP